MDKPKGIIRIEDFINWQANIIPENFIKPETNIYVANSRFIIVVNLPGVSKENIKIELSNNELTLYAKMPVTFEINECDFYIKEFRIGAYHRKFILSETIDKSNIIAKHENGQLTLILPNHKIPDKQEIVIK